MAEQKEVTETIRLTQYSHGAGCGCKIAPSVLDIILKNNESNNDYPNLMVGNSSRDDAAVYDLGNGMAMISTTDFFMPIVDDPFEFGRIAATNAISDVYAMGGTPNMAIAILGWPIDKLAPEVAGLVVAGGRKACSDAGIPLAGGHSIDCPEPVFGLAVNGLIETKNVKTNSAAREGDLLFLTKAIGVGVITTASKKGMVEEADLQLAIKSMTTLNKIGMVLGKLDYIHAITDVTGFGLMGHLTEMAEGSKLTALVEYQKIPILPAAALYIAKGCIPGGTERNWKSYGHKISLASEQMKTIVCDPQTSGGLLVAVDPAKVDAFRKVMVENGLGEMAEFSIGSFIKKTEYAVVVD
ncbi:MAG: selenide, water dikinase SelD [Bacteroidota bacterium]